MSDLRGPPHAISLRTGSHYTAIGFLAVYCTIVESKVRSLERQIEQIKRELIRVGPLRMGSLSEQYNVCGTPGCRCKASPPEKHGPYYQLSYTRKGKSTTRFVRRETLAAVKRQLRNYARLRILVNRWIDLAIELSDLETKVVKRSQSALGK